MSQPAQPLAVLAHACRFPGADSPAAFWQNLADGVASIREVPPERWSIAQLYAPPPYQPGKSITKWGAFLADIQRFDAAFFNIAAAEAQIMDPQQRILLELAYETLEQAAYTAERRQGLRIGVFLGIGQNSYSELTMPLLLSGQPTHPMLVANNIRNLVAGQIAHSLNLTGPALVVDTACSSSLVALHLARQSLLAGECELALVGGINLNITATPFVAFSSAGVLAATPHTYVFDERANGFVLGEGGGMLLLSTLSHATTAAAPVLGLICGSAINNDGRSLGTMTPSPTGQEALLRAAYATAAVPPETITYIEAHATGTRIGDVVEARALTRCFPQPPPTGVRYLGAVKPNVGHLLSAAAMPSLIKVLLAFQHRQLPPTLYSEQVRPIFKLDQAGLTINQTLVDWTPLAPGLPLRAGVSSFGFGGTNAHVILEEPPVHTLRAKASVPYAFAQTPYWVQKLESKQQKTENRKTENSGQAGEGLVNGIVAAVPLPPVEPGVDTWLQRVTWTEAPLWGKAMAQKCTTWLVLAVATPEAQTLAERLSRHLQGQGFACAYHCCQPGDEADLERWLAAHEQGWGLVFIGAVGSAASLPDQTALATGLANGIFSFHRVAQRLATSPAVQRPAGIWVVTAGAYGVENTTEAVAPERAALAGFAFALNDELVEVHCQVIDLAPAATVDFHLAQVAAELVVEPTRAVIAWRQRQAQWTRLVRQLAPRPALPAATMLTKLPKGVYLITGGATGIGAAVAQSLADLGMTLVLTGRTPLPRDPKRAALVMALRKAGATVEYIVADITQANEVAVLLDYIGQLYGPPVGVIHAAGVVRPQSLHHKSRADMEAVLAPKVIGAWLLAQELSHRAIEPACFVLFSSIASIRPGLAGGLSDYAAANAFLDALAASERQQGRACTVINWSLWAETGMGAQPAVVHHLATQGVAALTTAEGISAFYRALALAEGQVVVYKPQQVTTSLPLPTPPLLGEGTVDGATVPPQLGKGTVDGATVPPQLGKGTVDGATVPPQLGKGTVDGA
ncbi:MAG: SDR family NAD(P)-dependent oxidoreductase, partial [Caldilinea sp. CFX5]|nr:SDR family NAD(P)-dependent oxidoreductase [Caldilinea sp. CFX5]